MVMECKKERNLEFCNCTYQGCEKKGVCCDCVQYHIKLGQIPACFFPDDVEETFDRSIAKFIESQR